MDKNNPLYQLDKIKCIGTIVVTDIIMTWINGSKGVKRKNYLKKKGACIMGIIMIAKRYISLARKLRFRLFRNGWQRADYLRKHDSLAAIGSNVYYYSRIFPSDPKLLKLGDNVVICTEVRFLGHDRIDIILNGLFKENLEKDGDIYTKFYDPIEVGNNVFIGSDCVILPGTKIGDNTIIGAGAVVTKDLPPGKVWGGVPARCIGEFSTFIEKRKKEVHPESDFDKLWDNFYNTRNH